MEIRDVPTRIATAVRQEKSRARGSESQRYTLSDSGDGGSASYEDEGTNESSVRLMHVGCVLLATTRVKHEPLIEPGCIVSKTRSSGDLGEAMWVIGRPSVDPGDIMGVVSEEAAVAFLVI